MPTNEEDTMKSMMSLMQRFEPLCNLNESSLLQLAKGASSFQLGKRQKLLAADEHRWMVYLVSGQAQGKDAQGETFTLRPRKKDQAALFDAQPRPVEVSVVEDSQFLRVDRKQFSVLMNEQISSSTLVEEIDLEADGSDLLDSLLQSYQQGALKLPLREGVINTVAPLLAEGQSGTDEVLLDLMRSEPALTLVVAHMSATSGQFAPGELSHLRHLVDNVDRAQLAEELTDWGRKNPFPESGSPMYQSLVVAYDYLRRVGTFSRAIAKELPGVDAELAEYAGMCSKVGLISGWLMQFEANGTAPATHDSALAQLAPLVTEMLLGQMRIDPLVAASVEDANGPSAPQGEIRVGDVVRIAVTYLPIDIHGAHAGLVEDETLMARFNQAGIGLRELDIIMEKCNLDAGSNIRMAG